MEKINIKQKFSLFNQTWTPKIIAELNGQYIKLAKVKGEMVRHRHENEDEFFMVISGELTIEIRDRNIRLEPGEFFIVPKGMDHKPVSEKGAEVMLFEPKETQHTGNVKSDLTVEKLDWI